MTNDKDFQTRFSGSANLVGELENIADPEPAASAKALVQLLLDLHAAGLERVWKSSRKSDDRACASSMIWAAILWSAAFCSLWTSSSGSGEPRRPGGGKRFAPRVRKGGGELELIGIEDGTVRVADSSYRTRMRLHG